MAVVLNANDEDRVAAEVIFRVAGVRIMRGPDGALEVHIIHNPSRSDQRNIAAILVVLVK